VAFALVVALVALSGAAAFAVVWAFTRFVGWVVGGFSERSSGDARLQEGFRRLALFLGCIAFAIVGSITDSWVEEEYRLFPALTASLAFAGVWAVTRFVGWVVRGFFERGTGPAE
jgi:hypothetical protein